MAKNKNKAMIPIKNTKPKETPKSLFAIFVNTVP